MASSATPPPQDTSENYETQQDTSMTYQAEPGTNSEPHSWDKPWTVEEMRRKAGHWTLAGDAGMLMYLKEFSQNMLARTHKISKEVDSLSHEAKMTGVRVHTAFNDFIMLANSQFIENRVYDEDITQEAQMDEEKKTEEQSKTREKRESELIPKVKEALKLGVNVIDQAFEFLDTNAGNSDSDDEEGTYKVGLLLEAKDPYLHRALPHLIGSPEFLQDDNIGLTEDYSDEEDETDHGSVSETESEASEIDESDESGGSESEEEEQEDLFGTEKKKKQSAFSEESSTEEEGIEIEEDEADDEAQEKVPSGKIDFAAELAAKLGSPVAVSVTEDNDSTVHTNKGKKRSASTVKKSKKERDKEKTKSKSRHKKSEDDDCFLLNKMMRKITHYHYLEQGGLFSANKVYLNNDEEEVNTLFCGLFDDVEKKFKERKEN
ncbi:hypothetical protein ScPMuIL_007548 [Solemya velum]